MGHTLNEGYVPRFPFDENYSLSHQNNEFYVTSLAIWGMERIKSSAQPYHKKHKGVKDNGKTGKKVTVTVSDLIKIIKKSNGVSPDGTPIYFAPVGVLRSPGRAEEIGLVTSDERSRFPSFDRIDSSKGYTAENIQLTTKSFNLGKSNNNIKFTNEIIEKATLRWKGVEIELNQTTSSFIANTLRELTK